MQKGKTLVIARPSTCPLCNAPDRLIGHGWYTRNEPEESYEKLYGTFYIYRFLCKACRHTLSMHPDFSHAYKRYALNLVIFLLSERFMKDCSRYELCDLHDISPRTLQRWERGFADNEPIKHICFFPGSRSPPDTLFAAQLLTHFTTMGNGDAETWAGGAMLRLEHDFQCRLY